MIAVIIAGGSGTRLWPLSTPSHPKHLLTIDGDSASLLQNAYARMDRLASEIYVISEAGHIQQVRDQLPELNPNHFIVEPARRGTASCIVAALERLARTHDASEPIAFSPADHYIRDNDGFARSFHVAAETAAREQKIVLVGVEPTYPATGFGYIRKGALLSGGDTVYQVDSFKEKPDFQTAQQYLKSGQYLWNAGYFVGSVSTFQAMLRDFSPTWAENYAKLAAAETREYEQVYLGFVNVSIDYALIEKVRGLLVVPASFDWMDLGSFADMHKAVEQDDQQNHLMGRVEIEEVENSFVQNLEDKPVVVIGLDNIVVVNTPHGILVARKDLSQKVGDVSKRINTGNN